MSPTGGRSDRSSRLRNAVSATATTTAPVRVREHHDRAQQVFAGPDADLESRVRATVAIGGLARVTGFVATDDVDALRELGVEAALDALGVVRPS